MPLLLSAVSLLSLWILLVFFEAGMLLLSAQHREAPLAVEAVRGFCVAGNDGSCYK